jgi:hypothetical protein
VIEWSVHDLGFTSLHRVATFASLTSKCSPQQQSQGVEELLALYEMMIKLPYHLCKSVLGSNVEALK